MHKSIYSNITILCENDVILLLAQYYKHKKIIKQLKHEFSIIAKALQNRDNDLYYKSINNLKKIINKKSRDMRAIRHELNKRWLMNVFLTNTGEK